MLLPKLQFGIPCPRKFFAEMMDTDVRVEVGGGRREISRQIDAREVSEEDFLQEALRRATRHQVEEGIMPSWMQAVLAQIADKMIFERLGNAEDTRDRQDAVLHAHQLPHRLASVSEELDGFANILFRFE